MKYEQDNGDDQQLEESGGQTEEGGDCRTQLEETTQRLATADAADVVVVEGDTATARHVTRHGNVATEASVIVERHRPAAAQLDLQKVEQSLRVVVVWRALQMSEQLVGGEGLQLLFWWLDCARNNGSHLDLLTLVPNPCTMACMIVAI